MHNKLVFLLNDLKYKYFCFSNLIMVIVCCDAWIIEINSVDMYC